MDPISSRRSCSSASATAIDVNRQPSLDDRSKAAAEAGTRASLVKG
jgi:hypothetical protein